MEVFDIFIIVGVITSPFLFASLGLLIGSMDNLKEKDNLYDN